MKRVPGKGTRRDGVHVAFLRAVNVGGRNRLPMTDVAALFLDAGCAEVRTYIQSGNVLFRAESALVRRLPALIAVAVSARFGFEAPVVTRTASELARIARDNPFLQEGADPKTLHVVFLSNRPEKSRAALLDPDRSPPDRFVLRGREIYLRCPNGVARSRLTAQYFDSTLKTTSTFRNWNTVLRTLELARLPVLSG